MTPKIPLHTEAKKILTRDIKTILSNCKIDKGFPEFNEKASAVIEKYWDEVRKHKSKWMGNNEALILIYRQISDYLNERLKEKRFEFSGDLKDIEGTKGIKNLCVKIILFLDSIPREYFVFFELPASKGIVVKEISLADDIAFVERVKDDDFSEIKIQRRRGMGLLGIYGNSLKKERIYVRIRIEGYVGSLESITVKKAFSKFKQVVLLGKYSNILIDVPPKAGGLSEIFAPNSNITSEIIVWNADASEPSYNFNTSRAVFDYISKIGINEDVLKPDNYELFFDKFENKDSPTPADKAKLLKKRFDNPVRLFNTSDDDKNSEPIKTAIEWAFDSFTNDDQTFAFIQACIGIEAILGDKKSEGDITKTLADRCAYLIGSNIIKRKQIKENFLKLYDDRSKLIHGRKAYLNKEELGKLRYAQYILRRIILKEISNIG